MEIPPDELVIVSPDEGSIKRAVGHAKRLGGEIAIIDKRRRSANVTVQANIIGGPIENKICLMFDDMISTAGSICGAANMLKDKGARQIHVAATHGVFAEPAIERLNEAPIDSVVVTNTIPFPRDSSSLAKLQVLSVANLLGEAIKRIHHDQSISEIFS